jgi:hypothetical protein
LCGLAGLHDHRGRSLLALLGGGSQRGLGGTQCRGLLGRLYLRHQRHQITLDLVERGLQLSLRGACRIQVSIHPRHSLLL